MAVFLLNLTTVIEVFLLITFVMSLMLVFVFINMELVKIPAMMMEYNGLKVSRVWRTLSSFPLVFLLFTMPIIPLIIHFTDDGPIVDIWSIYIETIFVLVVLTSFISFNVFKVKINRILKKS